MAYSHRKSFALIWTIALSYTFCSGALASDSEKLSEAQMREFLLKAKVVKEKRAGKGITSPFRLTLTDGNLVHDASFQPVDELRSSIQYRTGRTELNFHDSYKYNIAAFELAKLLGLDDMMPVTVERKHGGKKGALSWWLPVKMDEEERMQKGIAPPDVQAWNRQMDKMMVFAQLVYDTDRNRGNVLISENWHLWMVDFSRAFRRFDDLENPEKLVRCDRQLLENLRKLDADDVAMKTKNFLTQKEIESLMVRRDKIVAYFENLIAKKGESEVLY